MKSDDISELIKEINLLSAYTFRGHLWAGMSQTRPSIEIRLTNKVIIEIDMMELLADTYNSMLDKIVTKLRVLLDARDKGVDIYTIEDYDKFFEIHEVLYND